MAVDTLDYLWRVEKGEREGLVVPVTNGGIAFDIPDYTVDAQIKDEPGGTTLYTFPVEHITVAGSTVELLIPKPISDLWAFTVAWFRVVITAPDPDPDNPESHVIIRGPFLVEKY